ncbi:hypothetical protein EXIGLDRAFT_127721 [Exidia glandulosa HHB12029]|uniref:Uncharacterized protein n=1 Tax=Exidia glandulosa HHB12029 TaxID=1314781 RepID=A0A165G967_EXIGL|nr:hypothetical protein EXIGLDRAFT_127721 [Exidia glandulosa HHB12029]
MSRPRRRVRSLCGTGHAFGCPALHIPAPSLPPSNSARKRHINQNSARPSSNSSSRPSSFCSLCSWIRSSRTRLHCFPVPIPVAQTATPPASKRGSFRPRSRGGDNRTALLSRLPARCAATSLLRKRTAGSTFEGGHVHARSSALVRFEYRPLSSPCRCRHVCSIQCAQTLLFSRSQQGVISSRATSGLSEPRR